MLLPRIRRSRETGTMASPNELMHSAVTGSRRVPEAASRITWRTFSQTSRLSSSAQPARG